MRRIASALVVVFVLFVAQRPIRAQENWPQFRGADAHRKHLEACFPYMQGPITFDLHEVSIVSQGDLAFCHFTAHCGCTGHDGKEHWSWLRMTACLRRIGDQWLIVHDHCSAPFDPMSGKVMLDAGPDEFKRAKAA